MSNLFRSRPVVWVQPGDWVLYEGKMFLVERTSKLKTKMLLFVSKHNQQERSHIVLDRSGQILIYSRGWPSDVY